MPGPTNGVSLMRPERWGQSAWALMANSRHRSREASRASHEAHWGGEISRYDNPWLFARQCAQMFGDLLDRDDSHAVRPRGGTKIRTPGSRCRDNVPRSKA